MVNPFGGALSTALHFLDAGRQVFSFAVRRRRLVRVLQHAICMEESQP
jgi:hypothetical protein